MGTRLSTEAFPGEELCRESRSGLAGTPASHPAVQSSPSHPLTQQVGTTGVCQEQNKRPCWCQLYQKGLRYHWWGFLGQSPLQVLLFGMEMGGFTLHATKILANGLWESSYPRFQREIEAPWAVLQQGREKRAVSMSTFSGAIFPVAQKYLAKKREYPMPGFVSGLPCRKLPEGSTSKLCSFHSSLVN